MNNIELEKLHKSLEELKIDLKEIVYISNNQIFPGNKNLIDLGYIPTNFKLDTCKPGDKLLLSDNTIAEYMEIYPYKEKHHIVKFKNRVKTLVTNEGLIYGKNYFNVANITKIL